MQESAWELKIFHVDLSMGLIHIEVLFYECATDFNADALVSKNIL